MNAPREGAGTQKWMQSHGVQGPHDDSGVQGHRKGARGKGLGVSGPQEGSGAQNWGDTVTRGCRRGAGPLGEGGPQCVHHVGESGEHPQGE